MSAARLGTASGDGHQSHSAAYLCFLSDGLMLIPLCNHLVNARKSVGEKLCVSLSYS